MHVEIDPTQEFFDLSHGWYVDRDNNKLFQFNGISLGELAQLEIFLKLRPGTEKNSKKLVQFVKDRGYAWHLRFAYGRAMPGQSKRINAEGLVLFDVRNGPAIQAMNAVATELAKQGQEVACIMSDPGLRKYLNGGVQSFSYSSFFGRDQMSQVSKAWKIIRQELEDNEEQIKRYLTESGIVTEETANGILAFLYPYFHQTIRDILSLQNLTSIVKPRYFVVATDSHKLGRLIALMGKGSNWATTVVQHGMPGLQFAYVPVYADKIAVWGEESSRWFMERGVPREDIFISGNPRFDSYKAAFCNQGVKPSKIIVIGTTAADDNLSITRMVIAAIADTDIKLVIKPHPSHSNMSYFSSIPLRESVDMTVLPAEISMQDIVRPCDIVVLTNSSAGVDALLLGGQLIVIKLPGNRAKASYHKLGNLIKWAANSSDLRQAISEYLNDRSDKNSIVKGIENYLQSTLGELDGNATKRLARFIIDTADRA